MTERYCLYARTPDNHLVRTHVQHPPWPLQAAEADITCNDLLRPWLPELDPLAPAHLHFARRLDVVVWPEEPCGPAG